MRSIIIIFILSLGCLCLSSQQTVMELQESENNIDEGIHLFKGNGSLDLINGTRGINAFQPRIHGISTSTTSPGLTLVGDPDIDLPGRRGILLRAGSTSALSNIYALKVQNFRTDLLTIHADGNVGIGTSDPNTKVEVADGDIYINDLTHGIIMKSENGTCWRYRPDNSGNLSGVSVSCP